MKTHIPLLTCLLLCAAPALALINLGDARIDLRVASSLYHDTSITASSAELDDMVFALAPSLTYFRPSRHFDLRAVAGVSIERYFDYTEFDDENFFFDLSINPEAELRTSRFTFTGDLIMRSETRSNEDIGQIVTTRRYGVSGQLVYDPNPRYNLILNASASREDPDDDSLNRIDRLSSGLTLQVPFGEGRFANLGIRYSVYRPDAPTLPDSDAIATFVGLGGRLLPKLDGAASAGYQTRSVKGGADSSAPYLSARLTWRQSETTTFSLSASNHFESTINNYNTETATVSFSAGRQLNPRWDAAAALGYLQTTYQSAVFPDRKDDEVFGQFQLGRQLTTWGRIGADVRYSERSSDAAAFDYSRLRAGLVFSGTW